MGVLFFSQNRKIRSEPKFVGLTVSPSEGTASSDETIIGIIVTSDRPWAFEGAIYGTVRPDFIWVPKDVGESQIEMLTNTEWETQ